jgi:hypothetical protein
VDIFGRMVVLLGQGVKEFFNFTLTRAHTPVMWIGRAIRGDLIVQDTAWCEYPFAPSVIRCCSTFNLDASRYKNCHATPMLALLLLLGYFIRYLSLLLDGTCLTGGVLLR